MDSKADIQHNTLIHLENSMLMYTVYNTETLEKLIKTVHNIHSIITYTALLPPMKDCSQGNTALLYLKHFMHIL